jgi:hypothetical protein
MGPDNVPIVAKLLSGKVARVSREETDAGPMVVSAHEGSG